MTSKNEESPVGYPGFVVMRPPSLLPTTATLKRVALAKLADIAAISASFGDMVLFQPWLTVLVDYGERASLTGVYRTSEGVERDAEYPIFPAYCLRTSEWSREADLQNLKTADNLREYLLNAPQVETRLVFASHVTHPEISEVMEQVLVVLGSGIAVYPEGSHAAGWQHVAVDLADDRLICSVGYSPLIAQSPALEAALPIWLDRINQLLQRDGVKPDGKVRISIRRSVPELAWAYDGAAPGSVDS